MSRLSKLTIGIPLGFLGLSAFLYFVGTFWLHSRTSLVLNRWNAVPFINCKSALANDTWITIKLSQNIPHRERAIEAIKETIQVECNPTVPMLFQTYYPPSDPQFTIVIPGILSRTTRAFGITNQLPDIDSKQPTSSWKEYRRFIEQNMPATPLADLGFAKWTAISTTSLRVRQSTFSHGNAPLLASIFSNNDSASYYVFKGAFQLSPAAERNLNQGKAPALDVTLFIKSHGSANPVALRYVYVPTEDRFIVTEIDLAFMHGHEPKDYYFL
jgi:hypothetical protein